MPAKRGVLLWQEEGGVKINKNSRSHGGAGVKCLVPDRTAIFLLGSPLLLTGGTDWAGDDKPLPIGGSS